MQSVGHILKKARREVGMSLEQASDKTKIHKRFLSALEEGDYSQISSPLYIRGFLKNYSKILGLDPETVLAFWRREYDRKEEEGKTSVPPRLFKSSLKFTPALLSSVFFAIVAIFFLGYLYSQYHRYAGPPLLEITSPTDGQVLEEAQVVVAGKTSRGSLLTLNGQEIEVLPDGSFSTNIAVLEGRNSLHFVSRNKFGKQSSREILVFFKPT